MTVKYIVGSPGRSGSIFVTLTIAQSLKIRPVFSNQESLPVTDQPIVYHSHDAQLQLDADICMLHVVRNDLYHEVISAVVCEHYNEWSVYTANRPPFVADIEIFEQKYNWHKYWHLAHRTLTNYKNRQTLLFEEFIGRSEVICDQLGIPRVKINTEKNPHGEHSILNYNELRQRFKELETQPLPDQWSADEWKDLTSK